MILRCKCGKYLTEDLYPVNPKYNKHGYTTNSKMFEKSTEEECYTTDEKGDPVQEVYTQKGRFKKGIFVKLRSHKYNWDFSCSGIKDYFAVVKKPARIAVSENSILHGIIPPFKSGYGCCNWSMGHELLCPDCQSVLGGLHLDCYEDGAIDFLEKAVVRVYKGKNKHEH